MKKTPEIKDRLRMYGFVPYNLSPIQQGIQFGHAVVEYQLDSDNLVKNPELYQEWANEHKTFIILNGGTTKNETTMTLLSDDFEGLDIGGIQKAARQLDELGVPMSGFYEPDLNDALTSIVFIVEEQVYNKKKFPSYDDYVAEQDQPIDGWVPNFNTYVADVFGDIDKGHRWLEMRKFLDQYRLA